MLDSADRGFYIFGNAFRPRICVGRNGAGASGDGVQYLATTRRARSFFRCQRSNESFESVARSLAAAVVHEPAFGGYAADGSCGRSTEAGSSCG